MKDFLGISAEMAAKITFLKYELFEKNCMEKQ